MKGNEAEILLRDMQEYRELTDRVKAIYGDQMTLKDMVDVMERIIREPGRKDPVNARILTYDEAAMWDEYRKLGTPEDLREMMDNGSFTGIELAQIAAIQMKLKKYEDIGTVEECRAAIEKQKTEKHMEEWGIFGNPEEKDIDRLEALHHKILYSKLAESVTEQEMIAFIRAKYALKKQLSEHPVDKTKPDN